MMRDDAALQLDFLFIRSLVRSPGTFVDRSEIAGDIIVDCKKLRNRHKTGFAGAIAL
jgi:hypothetical protein